MLILRDIQQAAVQKQYVQLSKKKQCNKSFYKNKEKTLTENGYCDKVFLFEKLNKMRKQSIHSHPVVIELTGVKMSSNLVCYIY